MPVKEEEPEESTQVPSFVAPEVDTDANEPEEDYEYSMPKEKPNVDSILNKASYFRNIEEEVNEEIKENVIQTIGLEFMRKVSELDEYERKLKKREREMAARERILSKIEKEIMNKEDRQKSILQSTKEKETDIKRKEKELLERESDLNRKIIEFNKKISMFQQTFESISTVE